MPVPDERGFNFLEKFILKHYHKQPGWVRAVTFLAFVVLMINAIARVTGGEFAAGGRIMEITQDTRGMRGKRPVRSHEVRYGEKFFGTNSKGFYHVILGPVAYSRLLVDGKARLEVLHEDISVYEQDVKFQRFQGLFDDVVLDPQVRAAGTAPAQVPEPQVSALFPVAYAQPPAGTRIIVYAIQLASGLSDVKEARAQLRVGGTTAELLATRTGSASGALPLSAGDAVIFDGDYYFLLPTGQKGAVISIELSAKMGYFSSYQETFRVSEEPQPGHRLTVRGDRGSTIQLMAAHPYEVLLFNKADVLAVKPQLVSALLENGLHVRETRAPLGYGSQSNAIYGGKFVPHWAIQSAVRAVHAAGLPVKTIQYQLELKSGNQNQIQLGGSKACDERPAIPSEALTAILHAAGDGEFGSAIAPYTSCSTTPPPPQVKKPPVPRKR